MNPLSEAVVEAELTEIIKQVCEKFNIDVAIDENFCPGNFIKSHVLFGATCEVEGALGITIPNDCYVFGDNKRCQLSIKEAAKKIIKIARYGD